MRSFLINGVSRKDLFAFFTKTLLFLGVGEWGTFRPVIKINPDLSIFNLFGVLINLPV
jgi:hypothetical protein